MTLTPESELIELAQQIGLSLKKKKWMLATVESCTGGWIAQVITSIAGSSDWYERGFVTYSNRAKEEMVKVPSETLKIYGAVSLETARAMALGGLNASHAQCAIAVTGIAGPAGGNETKPVGTVCFGWSTVEGKIHVEQQRFVGDRYQVRLLSVKRALQGLLEQL